MTKYSHKILIAGGGSANIFGELRYHLDKGASLVSTGATHSQITYILRKKLPKDMEANDADLSALWEYTPPVAKPTIGVDVAEEGSDYTHIHRIVTVRLDCGHDRTWDVTADKKLYSKKDTVTCTECHTESRVWDVLRKVAKLREA